MPKRLPLTSQQRQKIFREYAKGVAPAEIAISHPGFGVTGQQIQNLILREGWAGKKREIADVREQSAAEILTKARQEVVEEFGEVLRHFATGLKVDAEKLSDGWSLVTNAAGASSLMRAKSLLQANAFEFYGVTPAPPSPPLANIIGALFVDSGSRSPVRVAVEQHGVSQGAAAISALDEPHASCLDTAS